MPLLLLLLMLIIAHDEYHCLPACQVTDALALKSEERAGPTNYPHPHRYRPPEVKERTKWWWYYQLKNAEEGKYHRLLQAALQSPDGFFSVEPVPGTQPCSCCVAKPGKEKGSVFGGDRTDPVPRVFGPQEYQRPQIRV